MFWKKNSSESAAIHWHPLTSLLQLDQIVEESKTQPVLIYKHSTRCGISSMALDRLERGWKATGDQLKTYFLDLISYREVSDAVAQKFQVYHESPQVILVKNGKVIYENSHMGISFEALKTAL